MAGRRRRPGTDILERVENTLGHSIVKDWGGRLPAVPPTLRGGPLTSSEFGTGDDSDQALVEHVNLSLSDFPVPASGGGDLAWDVVAGSPQQVRGFSSLMAQIPSGPVTDIPIDVTGAGIVTLKWKWGDYPDGFKMAGDITITLTRGTSTIVQTTTVSPATRRGDGVTSGWEFESGDTLTVAFPNSSVSSQTLAEARVGVMIWEVAPGSSNVPVPAGAVDLDGMTTVTAANPQTLTAPASTADGDLLVVVGEYLTSLGSGAATWDPGAGWTLVDGEEGYGGSGQYSGWMAWKVASGITPGADLSLPSMSIPGSVFSFSSAFSVARIPQAEVMASGTAATATGTTHSVTVPGSSGTPLVFLQLYGSGITEADVTFTAGSSVFTDPIPLGTNGRRTFLATSTTDQVAVSVPSSMQHLSIPIRLAPA